MRDYKVININPITGGVTIEKKAKGFEGVKLLTREEFQSNKPIDWIGPVVYEERIQALRVKPLTKGSPTTSSGSL